MQISTTPILCSRRQQTVIIEGCGIFDDRLVGCYDLRLFVASDWVTALPAIRARDGDYFLNEWQTMFLPSDEIYLATRPETRADFQVAGRGLGFATS